MRKILSLVAVVVFLALPVLAAVDANSQPTSKPSSKPASLPAKTR